MTYDTLNPVPSTDPRDLDDNAQAFDRFLQSAAASEPDRLGAQRKTWSQMERDAAALASPNVTGLSSLSSAANKGFYFTNSSGAMATYDLTAQARTFAAASTQAAQRAALGLGSSATLDTTGGGLNRIAKDTPTMSKVTDGFWRGLGGFLDLRGTYLETGTPLEVENIGFVTGFVQLSSMGITSAILPGAAYGHLTIVTPLNGKSGVVGQTTIRTVRSGQYETVSYATSDTTWSAWSEPNVRGGANSSITSLSGLTTALSTAQGGTGNTSGAAASLSTSRSITATGDGAWTVSFNGSSNVSAAFTLSSTGVSAGTYGGVTVDAKGRVTKGTAITPVANGGTGGNTQATARTGLGVAYSSWVNVTLQNSWAIISGRRAAYRTFLDMVHLEIQISAGTATDGTVLFTLPAGVRPLLTLVVPVIAAPSTAPSSTVALPRVVINTDGTVTCFNVTSTAGISFSTQFATV